MNTDPQAQQLRLLRQRASHLRTLAGEFLTGELTPVEFLREAHETIYKFQRSLNIKKVRLITQKSLGFQQAAPVVDPTKIGSDEAIEFIKQHGLTLPKAGFWYMVHDTYERKDEFGKESRKFPRTGYVLGFGQKPQYHGLRRITNGVDVAVVRGDGTVFWTLLGNWVLDKVPRGGRVKENGELTTPVGLKQEAKVKEILKQLFG